jgi:hypothetical protein
MSASLHHEDYISDSEADPQQDFDLADPSVGIDEDVRTPSESS